MLVLFAIELPTQALTMVAEQFSKNSMIIEALLEDYLAKPWPEDDGTTWAAYVSALWLCVFVYECAKPHLLFTIALHSVCNLLLYCVLFVSFCFGLFIMLCYYFLHVFPLSGIVDDRRWRPAWSRR
jgi:hypothetical protein